MFVSISTVLLWLKKTRDWINQKAKWLYSKWPYAIIQKQKEEIERLKGKQLSKEEVLILQSLWAFGTDFTVTQSRVMGILNCKSQKASYFLQKLNDAGKIYYDSSEGGYKLTTAGQKYIVEHNHEISKDEFVKMLEDQGKLSQSV